MRNGENTKFWHAKWRGSVPLREKYPRLFAMSNQKESLVEDIWRMNGGVREWEFSWRRRFFVWEEEILANVMVDLEAHVWNGCRDG